MSKPARQQQRPEPTEKRGPIKNISEGDQKRFAEETVALEKRLGRSSSLDERVDLMQEITGRELMPAEIVRIARRIRVSIHKTGIKGEVDPVPISVNGYAITIKRGETVSIPEHFLTALENAVESKYEFMPEGNDPSVVVATETLAPSYPYSVDHRTTH